MSSPNGLPLPDRAAPRSDQSPCFASVHHNICAEPLPKLSLKPSPPPRTTTTTTSVCLFFPPPSLHHSPLPSLPSLSLLQPAGSTCARTHVQRTNQAGRPVPVTIDGGQWCACACAPDRFFFFFERERERGKGGGRRRAYAHASARMSRQEGGKNKNKSARAKLTSGGGGL